MPRQTSRRTLTRGVAWALPVAVIAAPAPAYAASKCATYSMGYSNHPGVTASGFTLGGVTVSTAVSATANTGTVFPANGTVGSQVRQTSGSSTLRALGNTRDNCLLFNLDGTATSTLVMSFSQAVANLVLGWRDVGNDPANRSLDSLTFSPSAERYTNQTNSGVPISSPPAPLQRTSVGYNDGWTYVDAQATFPGPLNSLTVTFRNAYVPDPGTVAVGIYGISFCA